MISRIFLPFLLLGVLVMTNAPMAWAETSSEGLNLGFSVRSNEAGDIIWNIQSSDGAVDFTEDEVHRKLRDTIYPETLKRAKAGETPANWKIGFFYLDGVVTGKDLEKAKAAFRLGLEEGRSDGLRFLADLYYREGINHEGDPDVQTISFSEAEALITEVLEAGHKEALGLAIDLASVHMFGWYGAPRDAERALIVLNTAGENFPDNPVVQHRKAKFFIRQKDYKQAHQFALQAEKGYGEMPQDIDGLAEELEDVRSIRMAAAVLEGDFSKIDPEELIEISKDSLGLNGPMAWAIPLIVILLLFLLLRMSHRSWQSGDGTGPGLRLSVTWISVAILAAGIGFNIRLPGLDNGAGLWIGAILVTAFCLAGVQIGGRERYFGADPLLAGMGPLWKGLGIVLGCVVVMQLVVMGYAVVYEAIAGRPLEKQLVSLLIRSDNLTELLGTVLIVGIAIPFYEEFLFRGLLFDALERRWSRNTALVTSSVAFAIVHGLTFFVPLLFLSFALGWLRIRTGNLRMSFFLHAVNNTASVVGCYFLAT